MSRTRPFEHPTSLYSFAIFAVLALSLLAAPASAAGNNCLQDEYSKTASQKLTCTANDVKVAKVINIRHLDGTPLTSCNSGSTFSFIADFLVQTSSKSSRSNIGLYFATASGQSNALKGQCSDNVIPAAPYTCPGGTATCQTSNYDELDASPDNCGDSSSSDPTVCLDASGSVVSCPAPAGGSTLTGTQIVTIEVNDFSCTAPADTNQLVLQNCTSWQVPGSATLCEAAPPTYPYPFDANNLPEAIPGSPSKCNCSTIPLGITVQSPSISVTKNCSTAKGSGTLPDPSCSMDDPGGTVTYTVDVSNTSNFGSITLDQICDNAYGDIATASGFTPACSAGGIGTKTGTTCSVPQTIAAGSDYSCTFTASQGEGTPVTDIATTNGIGQDGTTRFSGSSNSVTVSVNEAASTATITKSLSSTKAGCATVRYGVDVANTSSADEDLTLSTLNDTFFGSITTVHGAVLGTTCGVAGSTGLGSLSALPGAGALPASLPVGGSDYTCQFDAQFCGPLTSVPDGKGGLCSGIENVDKVTATMTSDETGVVVTQTANTLTVDECISGSSSSTIP